jgi:hypothetical protein
LVEILRDPDESDDVKFYTLLALRDMGTPDSHRHLPAVVGEVDVDVAEVRLAAVPRRMIERNERLTPSPPASLQLSANLVVLAAVAVLRHQPTVNLRRRVPLLRRYLKLSAIRVSDRKRLRNGV